MSPKRVLQTLFLYEIYLSPENSREFIPHLDDMEQAPMRVITESH